MPAALGLAAGMKKSRQSLLPPLHVEVERSYTVTGADLGLQYCTFDDASGTCSVGETTPCPPEEHAARVYRSKDLNKAEVRARSM